MDYTGKRKDNPYKRANEELRGLEDGEIAILARHECKIAVLLDIFLPPPKPLFPLDYVKKKLTRPNSNVF